MKTIKIFDTTLRDGEQTPGVNLNIDEKVIIAKKLDKMGVDVIEAGFATASQGDFDAIVGIANAVENATVASLSRAHKQDIDKAWDSIKTAKYPRIHTFIATSDIHMKYKLKMTKQEVYDKAIEMVTYAKSKCEDIEFSCEDATRSDKEFMYEILEGVINAGATTVNIPDTVGYTYPDEYYNLIKDIKKNVPNIDKAEISVHCHNDLGLATANAAAAIKAGADQVECTMNGLGERAGNTALEEITVLIKTREKDFDAKTNIIHTEIASTSEIVSSLTGVAVQINKSIVGANAFAHESGIHQHGVLENKSTYEIVTPESVGYTTNKMVFGKHSGKHAFKDKLKEMGYEFTEEKITNLFKKFKKLTDVKKEIFDKDIQAIAQGGMNSNQSHSTNIELESFNIVRENNEIIAKTIIINDDIRITNEGKGDGPVDALYKSINKALDQEYKVISYNIAGITHGADAQGQIIVKVEKDGKEAFAKETGTDIVRASGMAYIKAINKIRNA